MKRVIIGGSGFFGATCARILAESGYEVIVLEKEKHIGGLAYDYIDPKIGIEIHKYGPHILNIKNRKIYDFLAKYAELKNCEVIRRVKVDGLLLPLPINLSGIQKLAHMEGISDIENRLKTLEKEEITVGELLQSSDSVISSVAKTIYEKVYLGYNVKMWGKRPEKVDSQTINRMPIRLDNALGLSSESKHVLPINGYTNLFYKMLSHENIKIYYKTDFVKYWNELQKNGDDKKYIGIFSGPIDELFLYEYGILQYRSMIFKKTYHNKSISEDSCVITYPMNFRKTRSTDMGMLVGTKKDETAWISEYPRAYVPENRQSGKPAYPVNDYEDKFILNKYLEKLEKIDNLYVGGRLGEYKYYNMEETIQSALKCAEEVRKNDR